LVTLSKVGTGIEPHLAIETPGEIVVGDVGSVNGHETAGTGGDLPPCRCHVTAHYNVDQVLVMDVDKGVNHCLVLPIGLQEELDVLCHAAAQPEARPAHLEFLRSLPGSTIVVISGDELGLDPKAEIDFGIIGDFQFCPGPGSHRHGQDHN
jgi:hypothetical protein